MVSSTHLLAFALTSLVIIAVPGPSVMFAVSRALVLGRRGALVTVLGNTSGVYVQVVAVAFGLGALLARSATAFTVVKLAGAAYLVYLGVQAVRHRRALSVAPGTAAPVVSTRRAFREGFIVGLTNPKAMVFFAAALPQFITPGGAGPATQMLLLGAVFAGIAVVSDGSWALGAGAARDWLVRSPRRLAQIGGFGGLAMIGIGAQLAVSGRHD